MNAATKALGNVKKKVVGVASDVLSAPARAYYGAKGRQADRDTAILKLARNGKGAPQFSGGKPTTAFMAQTMADEVRSRRMKK